jgi:anaerobic magnesium-protoporphyrin IX monomethyl ester cyclase
MNILFIKTSIGTSDYSCFDAGIGSMTALLIQAGHKVRLFYLDDWSSFERLIERINIFKPDILAYSATASSFIPLVEISKRLRQKFPKIKQVCGGVHITLCPEDFYNAKSLDAICIGEGEYVFLDFIKRLNKNSYNWLHTKGFWTRKGSKIYKNPPSSIILDLEALPIPDREIFSNEGILHFPRNGGSEPNRRGLEFIFTRGCPFNCSYCSNHALHNFYGKWYVRRISPEKAIAEIKAVIEIYHYDFFRFHDDTFTADHRWLNQFLTLYKKQIHIPFSCNIRVDTCSEELLNKMKDAGCNEITIGLESGDQFIRSSILKRMMTNQQIIKTFQWAKDIGIKTFAFIMIGFPEEKPNNFLNTIKLTAQIEPDSYVLYIFYPYPGTELYNVCIKNSYIVKKRPSDFIERQDTILNLPNFSRADILYYYHHFNFLVDINKFNNNILKKFHKKFLFFILKIPPSNILHPIMQTVYHIDRIIIRLSKIVINLIRLRHD